MHFMLAKSQRMIQRYLAEKHRNEKTVRDKNMKKHIAFLVCMILCMSLVLPAWAADDAAPVTVGTTITLGEYEQDDDPDNGAEPIEWIVLDVEGNKALVLSKYLLDTIMYNDRATHITWEECSLRSWLNNDFLTTAFDEAAQQAVLLTEVKNGIDQGVDGLSVDGGNDTEDYVFLLSYKEVLKYFKTETLRISTPTPYAAARYGTPSWYTRCPGGDLARVIVIHADGNYWSGYVDYKDTFIKKHTWQGVRPAMWIDLEQVEKSAGYSVCTDAFNALQDLEDRIAAMQAPADERLYSTVTFGAYEQDNDPDNGTEPIEWLVLDIKDDACLLISKDILDVEKVMHWETKTSWEKCELRTWLNGDFATAAFKEEELSGIIETELDNRYNKTMDKVFLLSYDEVGQYFPDDASRLCASSEAALAKMEARVKKEVNQIGWWTRSTPTVHTPTGWGSPEPVAIGGESDQFELVTIFGYRSDLVVDALTGIRPAVWVSLDAVASQF